jgi:hypothetical protein
MKYIKLKNLQIFIEKNLICLLFSFYIFFWGIAFNFVQLRFLIFLLILPIFLKIGQITLIKLFKYSIIPTTLLFHLTLQASTLTSNHFFSILGLFFFLIILDIYKDFFFRNLNKIIYFFLIIFFLFVIFQYFSYSDYASQVSNDCVGCFSILKVFFKENSHLALIAPTVIFYLLFISNSNKFLNFFTIIIFSFICIVNPSLTLYLGLFLLTLLTFFFKVKLLKFQKIFIIFLTFFILLKLFSNPVSRTKVLDFISKNNNINLSTEVYKTSFFVAKNSLLHKPLGYGFNNYSEAFYQFRPTFDNYNKEVFLLNKEDASNNLSKIVTEFGIFSLLFLYFLINFFLSKKIDMRLKIFFLLPILIQTFIRGAGYFNGGFLLFLFYSIYLLLKK